jgi:hypothetical protein
MAVGLVNPSNQPFTVTLYHDVFCEAAKACSCSKERVTRPVRGRDGSFGQRVEMRLIPVSFTIDGGKRKMGIHDAVLQVPQVKAAMAMTPPLLRAVLVQEEANFPKAEVAPSPTVTQPQRENPSPADESRSRRQFRRGRGEG